MPYTSHAYLSSQVASRQLIVSKPLLRHQLSPTLTLWQTPSMRAMSTGGAVSRLFARFLKLRYFVVGSAVGGGVTLQRVGDEERNIPIFHLHTFYASVWVHCCFDCDACFTIAHCGFARSVNSITKDRYSHEKIHAEKKRNHFRLVYMQKYK